MTHFQVYLKQSGPDPRNQKPGPSPKASLWYRQATSKLHSLSLSSDHSPEWLFHTFSSYFQDLPSLTFSWWFCFPFSLRTSPRLPKRMSTNSHPQSHQPNYLCLNRALTPFLGIYCPFPRPTSSFGSQIPFSLCLLENTAPVVLSPASTIFPFLLNHSYQCTNILQWLASEKGLSPFIFSQGPPNFKSWFHPLSPVLSLSLSLFF